MTRIIKRLVDLFRTTIVALDVLWAAGATRKNVLMREGHQHCPSHLDENQSKNRDLLHDLHAHEFNLVNG
jgi:hypothetical protein